MWLIIVEYVQNSHVKFVQKREKHDFS